MRKTNITLIWLVVLGLSYASFRLFSNEGPQAAQAADSEGKSIMLAHNVYFSLNESTPANRQKLVDACKKYLANHPGTVYFGAGAVCDLDRPVNDRDFDVGLHLVFKDRAAHDAYQIAPLHEKFIAENKATWKKVRVFDTDVVVTAK
jgi:hypothetical protein